MHVIGALAICAIVCQVAHAAPPSLSQVEQECRDEIMTAQCPVGENCYQLWKPIARCTIERSTAESVSQSAIDLCIAQVDAARQKKRKCTACGDTTAEVMACLSE